ncbi:MAG: amino acid-binding protein, partial [Planctomycetes bacterium SM23_32]
MALEADRVDIWAVSVEDRPGGLAEKLAALA